MIYTKKQGVPWDCFLCYRLRMFYRQAMRSHLVFNSTFIGIIVLPFLTSSTIHTNRLHHLHLILSTDEELTLTSYKVLKLGRDYLLVKQATGVISPTECSSAYSRLRAYAFNKSTTESH